MTSTVGCRAPIFQYISKRFTATGHYRRIFVSDALTQFRPFRPPKALPKTGHSFSGHRGPVLRSKVSFDLIQPERDCSVGQMNS